MTDTETIIQTIAQSKKKTPVKVWVKGTIPPNLLQGLEFYRGEDFVLLFGDWDIMCCKMLETRKFVPARK